MAKLSKARAARQLGISRTSLYKLISEGRVSATSDGLIDEAELVRVAPYVDTFKDRTRTSMDTSPSSVHERPWSSMDTTIHRQERQPETPREHLVDSVHEQPWTPVHERPQASMDALVDILREQLQLAQEREHRYEARERAYQEHIAQLTTMLDQAHQQNQRLLDMPRSAPPAVASPPPRPVRPPAVSRPQRTAASSRKVSPDAVERILALHAEGLSLGKIAAQLTAEGVPTVQGGAWHKGVIGKVLTAHR